MRALTRVLSAAGAAFFAVSLGTGAAYASVDSPPTSPTTETSAGGDISVMYDEFGGTFYSYADCYNAGEAAQLRGAQSFDCVKFTRPANEPIRWELNIYHWF